MGVLARESGLVTRHAGEAEAGRDVGEVQGGVGILLGIQVSLSVSLVPIFYSYL